MYVTNKIIYLKTFRKPKYAVVTLNDNVDVGSFFNLLLSNGYSNVTFLTTLAEHVEVKKLLNRLPIKPEKEEKSEKPFKAIILDKRSNSPEIMGVKPGIDVKPSTSILISSSDIGADPTDFHMRSTSNIKLNPDASYINCSLCDNKIMVSRLSNLTNHVRRHSSVKQYSCVYCVYQHNEMSKVRTHMAGQHGDSHTSPNDNLTPELQKIWCAYMEKCFPGYLDSVGKTGKSALEVFGGRSLAKLDESSIIAHDEEEVNLMDKLHNCCECGDAVLGENESDDAFTEHIQQKHADVCTPYKCGECGFLAAYEYMVRGHIAAAHAMIAAEVEVLPQDSCDDFSLFVGKLFPSLGDVMPDITEELKAFVDTAQCNVEDGDYLLQNGFVPHSVEALPAEALLGCDLSSEIGDQLITPQIACSLCSASFSLDDVDGMIFHSKEHYYIKQFECPVCEFGANDLLEVQQHVYYAHDGEGNVLDHFSEDLQQAWMQVMKKCFPALCQKK